MESSIVNYAVQGDRSVSRHRGGQTDKFMQCDSELLKSSFNHIQDIGHIENISPLSVNVVWRRHKNDILKSYNNTSYSLNTMRYVSFCTSKKFLQSRSYDTLLPMCVNQLGKYSGCGRCVAL